MCCRAALSALGDLESLSTRGQVANDFTGIDVMHNRAARHDNVEVAAALAGSIPAGATRTALGRETPCDAEVGQGIRCIVCDQVDAASVAAVATIGTTFSNKFLTAKTQAAVATVSGFNANYGFVDEFHK